MSIIYDKSISPQYSKYFESKENISKNLCRYSIEKEKAFSSAKKHSWEIGNVGLPIVWDSQNNSVYVDHSDAHSLVIGPTGSKKSRLIIMPQVRILASGKESMIICDPKAEIYNRTSAYLNQKGYQIYVLNLRSPDRGYCWNPLIIPYQFYLNGDVDRAYEFINDIAQNIVHKELSNSDPFWDNSAGSLFFGLVALLFKICKERKNDISFVNIANVIRLRNELFSGSSGKNQVIWRYVREDSIITSSLIGTYDAPKDTRQSILSVFDQNVRFFSIQPNLLNMLATNEIDFDSIVSKPTAVFLLVPDEKTGYHSFVSLFVKQSYEYLIYKAQAEAEKNGQEVGKLKRRVNYLLDEFSSLPTINDFPAMITAARSRNIRFTLVIQSNHQLIKRYGDEAETIKTNCNNWVFLTSRELSLLEEISSICGKAGEQQKPVLSVTALQRLDKSQGEALVLIGRNKPFITHLADIECYDNNDYFALPIKSTIHNAVQYIDFDSLFNPKATQDNIDPTNKLPSSEQTDSPFTNHNPFSAVNFEEYIAALDKIAELEKEEAQLEENKIKPETDANIFSDENVSK